MWQEYQAAGLQVVGISNEPIATIQDFIEDQGITFPVLHDDQGLYGAYNLPGAASPYPRDFVLDADGIVRLAKHEYEPGVMISVIESLLRTVTEIDEPERVLNPKVPVLLSLFPNPFNPDARIRIDLQREQKVSLTLLDIRGRVVQEILQDEWLSAGQHQLSLKGEQLYSGVYFVQIETDYGRQIQKIVKLR